MTGKSANTDECPGPAASLVCPLDLQGLSAPQRDVLCCPSGHRFHVVGDAPDLTVVEDSLERLHHRPNRRLTSFTSYDDRRSAGPPGRVRAASFGRLRALREAVRGARFYRRNVPRACARLATELPAGRALPPEDGFESIFGPGLYAHGLLKRLEKELFWDRCSLTRPAYEIGTSDGYASRYFFTGRSIDFGSEYLIHDLVESRLSHSLRFSANVKFLPLPDATLETVFCSQTLTCVYASLVSVLSEINRVLRPGGRFLFTTHGPAYLRGLPLQGWPEMGLSARRCSRENERRANYMAHMYTLEEWRQILAATGFELAESRGILSLELARYSQLFYFRENGGPNVFRQPHRSGPLAPVVRLLFGGRAGYGECEATYREIMRRILGEELARNANAEFDHRSFLDGGFVAVKRRPLPDIQRLPARHSEE